MRAFRQPSVMSASQHFSQVPVTSPTRSTFDRSHGYKTTFDCDKLIPIFVDEVLPGDTHDLDCRAHCRLASPLKYPIMDNMFLDLHFWFVPSRLPWSHWQEFMGERKSPSDDPNDFTLPKCTITLGDIQPASLAGYFGLPLRAAGGDVTVSTIPFLSYCLIWNEWYRDENFQEPIDLDIEDGTFPGPSGLDPHDATSLLPRGKRKDYFTGALPWPQKGDSVPMPVGGNAPIVIPVSDRMTGFGYHTNAQQSVREAGGAGLIGMLETQPSSSLTSSVAPGVPTNTYLQAAHDITIDDPGGAYADLDSATATTINAFRTAYQIQCLLERDARGGTRYIELLFNHFEVKSPDARLQRPEYLGGGTIEILINPIAQTSVTSTTPQGNLTAIGTVSGRAGFSHSFVEHGFIIGLASARADLTYQAGVERFWSRTTRYDFAWPSLAHLGEQEILNKELFAAGTAADLEVWGYQERYAEYRYKPSRVTGVLASEAPSSLDAWHLSQDFATLPELNADFIQEAVPLDRCVAVPSEPHFVSDFWFRYKSTRVLPVYSVPGLTNVF